MKKQLVPLPTLQVIADRAGVSRVTVSHILGEKFATRYKKATRDKIHQLARELNYQPNRAAQTIKNGRSNLIAVVHFGARIEAAYKIDQTLAKMVCDQGFDYFALDMNWYGDNVDRAINEIIRMRAEGVLISHVQSNFTSKHIEKLHAAGIPVVGVNGGHNVNFPLICDDSERATRQLTEHLIKAGHKTILYLTPMLATSTDSGTAVPEGRISGFHRAIVRHGKHLALSEEEFFKQQNLLDNHDGEVLGIHIMQDPELYRKINKPVYRFCSKLFSGPIRPDAIMCRNDFYAVELFATAMEYGIRIPEDLAITGYDNDQLGSFAAFGITTAEQDAAQICAVAVKTLMEQMETRDYKVFTVRIPSQLITRTSCGQRHTSAVA